MNQPPLDRARLQLMQQCFEEAIDVDGAQREAILARVATTDADLADRVRRLLAAHDQSNATLASPVRRNGTEIDPWVGQRVGVYQVLRCIGIGGMSTVYEAVRDDDQFRNRVAIKFLRQHALTDAALQRFRDERQMLANLHHTNIAVLLDGGVTRDGQPYFVVEYLDGDPITRWCDARKLSIAQRLDLFVQVCAAVQHAHESLVVHRDIKPGNVMVAADGLVKLLDFGIARPLVTDDTGDSAEPVTQVGARAYTPDYASPEQLLGRPVGTRSDVYALGVLLHELLVGTRPFDLTGKSVAEIEHVVGQVAPGKPSNRVAANREDQVAERSIARLKAKLSGDLDAIVLKALRKEPERRYGSADEFASDIHNYLKGRPVAARPESVAYRFGKLVSRRRAESAGIAAAVVLLVGGSVATTLKAREAIRERERTADVKSFLTTMLGAANPASYGKDVKVRTVLDSAAARADTLKARPDLEAEVREIIGATYNALGEFELAEPQFKRALAIARAESPSGSRAVALAYSQLSSTLEFQGRYGDADSVLALAIPLFDRYGYTNETAHADALDRRGSLLVHLGKMKAAEPLLAEALAIQLRTLPVNDSARGYAYANLGMVRSELGKNQSAESLLVAAVAASKRAFGPVHPLVAAVLSPLATVQERAGEMDRADSTYRATLDMRRQLLGPEHPDYAWTMFNYADHLLLVGRNAEAADWCRKILALRGKSLMDSHPAVATAMSVLGRALDRMDSLASGERWLQQSWELRKANLPAEHFLIASSESILGEHFVLTGKFAEAERHLLSGEHALVAQRGEGAPIVRDARNRLVKLYTAWGKPDSAAAWKARMGT